MNQNEAIAALKAELERPVGRELDWRNPDFFDPWRLFEGMIYGSYNSDFDDMAILVLDNIANQRWGGDAGEGLAHEMFREMLCVINLCDYGTSPRGCFPTPEFRELLPALLAKWREYREVEWAE